MSRVLAYMLQRAFSDSLVHSFRKHPGAEVWPRLWSRSPRVKAKGPCPGGAPRPPGGGQAKEAGGGAGCMCAHAPVCHVKGILQRGRSALYLGKRGDCGHGEGKVQLMGRHQGEH